MENTATFNVRFVSGPSERVYRIYVRGSDLFFIQLAGLSATVEAAAFHFGPIGILFGELLKRRAKRNAKTTLQRADQQDPEQLLRENKNNFKVYIPEIRETVIEPPTLFQLHGKQAGRWNFSLRDGKKMRFEFENTEEMKTALSVLLKLLSATLQINVEWGETKKRFQKIKQHH